MTGASIFPHAHFYSRVLCALALAATPSLHADSPKPFDAAAAFGARPDIGDVSLSPDGASLVFLAPTQGQGSVAYTLSLAPGAKAKVAFFADGKPFRLSSCYWVANDRLACTAHGLVPNPYNNSTAGPINLWRTYAVNADGTKRQILSAPQSQFSNMYSPRDSQIIDWLPDQDGSVLMARVHLPNTHPGSYVGNDMHGVGVDLVDTRTLAAKPVVAPRAQAFEYLTDGHGTVRILAEHNFTPDGMRRSEITYFFRPEGSDDWHELSTYNSTDRSGFEPLAVDHDLNIAYGWQKLDGRMALYALNLDGSGYEHLVYSRPDVDLDGLVRIGRRNRVVGVSYTTDLPATEYFADDIKQILGDLHKALPQPLITVIDTSTDESKLLVYASSDTDPGTYYILDRQSRSLHRIFGRRLPLNGVTLARVKPITYAAADGQVIPAYLTLPPGVDNPRGLPAIVMPHGGVNSRDRWGFDWEAQFYAARGYVVLQPNIRGSGGYGDSWYQQKGYKSWEVAVGDVVAAGRWLVKEGIADPTKLGVVGWSYGGYVGLQSVAIDATLFKAIIAIGPMTDLAALKKESGFFNNYYEVSDFIGDGPHMRDGSPITHAAQFKQPVLLFHGTADLQVSVEESRHMAAALKAAGVQCELVTFEDRESDLEDSAVRTDMLRRSDAFLRRSFGMSP